MENGSPARRAAGLPVGTDRRPWPANQGSRFSVKMHLFSVQFSVFSEIFIFLDGEKNSGREHILFNKHFQNCFQITFLCAEPYTTRIIKPGKPPSCHWDRHHSSKVIASRHSGGRAYVYDA